MSISDYANVVLDTGTDTFVYLKGCVKQSTRTRIRKPIGCVIHLGLQ